MSEPIRSKIAEISEAPTPQNTPASNAGSLLSKSTTHPKVPKTIDEETDEDTKKKLANNPMFLSLIEGKLNNLVGKDSGYVDSFPKVVKDRIISLKSVQKKQMDLEIEFQKELFALEKKYNEKAKPLNAHRKKIIIGEIEPTEEEIEEGRAIEAELEGSDDEENEEDEDDENKIEEMDEPKLQDKEQEDEEAEEDKEQEDIKGIPEFWLTALLNLEPICDTITERDRDVLSHLIDIRMEHLDKPGFKLIFEFSKNDFFSNETLEKTYYYQEELGYTGEFIYDHAEGCEINWTSPEQNVTIKIERRKQRNKHTKQTRTIEKLTPTESFFNFFDPPTPPKIEEAAGEEDEEEDEEDGELEARLQLDYHIAEEIKDKLITRAVDWFTGAAIDFVDYEDPAYFDEDSEEDDDDEDDDDEDDEDGENAKQKDPQECKQQ